MLVKVLKLQSVIVKFLQRYQPQTMLRDACRVSGTNPPSLATPFAYPLPVTDILPTGWLKNQLEIQAAGLSSHLALFWADIEVSSLLRGFFMQLEFFLDWRRRRHWSS